jgi:glutamate N-acetyltransferase/amino-acid N-acetyltransferase
MKPTIKSIPAAINAPKGFQAAGVFCDIKRMGTGKGSDKGQKRDLAIIVSDREASVAGLFTTNQVCAAPVKLCVGHLRGGIAQAIVANSGNANACTGPQGAKDAFEMASVAAKRLALPMESVLVCSTGRIGVPMPMDEVKKGIESVVGLMGYSQESAHEAMEAIMTSDTRPKEYAVEFKLGGKTTRIAGMCKGAGMIQPGMSPDGKRPAATPLHATMLCFITTDAAVQPPVLQAALNEAVALSFNRITIDGDMSTNDSVIALANGLAENTPIKSLQSKDFALFQAALSHVTLELSKMIVRDGEGVSRFVTVRIEGAASDAEADIAARAVANSSLVKTSWCGGDPNWGRILDALGYSLATVVEDKIDLGYSAPGSRKIVYSLKQGKPTKATFKDLCALTAQKEFDLHVNLNLGKGRATIYAADLTEAYVDFNKGNVADPASLGG